MGLKIFLSGLVLALSTLFGVAVSQDAPLIRLGAQTRVMVPEGGTGVRTFTTGVISSTGTTTALVSTSTPTLAAFTATSTSATSSISTGGFTVGTNQFLVQSSSGNVGVGTTTPGSLFSISGIANLASATSTFYSTG